MFRKCTKFNSDLSKWNVGKVKYMTSMFDECENFNSDLSKWNVRNVVGIYGMFTWCIKFDCNLDDWDLSAFYSRQPKFDLIFDNSGMSRKPKWTV